MNYFLSGLIVAVCLLSFSCNKDDNSINTGNPGTCNNVNLNIEPTLSADTVFITASGGQAPYSYSIDGSYFSLINTFTNLDVGDNYIYVQDSRGCLGFDKVTVDYKSTVYDSRNSYTYKAAKIGDQVWMAENLKYSVDGYTYCYNDSSKNCTNLGTLYTQSYLSETCPTGYRIPTVEDFNQLTDTLSKLGDTYTQLTYKGSNTFAAELNGFKQNEYLNLGSGTAFWTSDFSVNGTDTLYTVFEISAPDQVTFNQTFTDSSAAYVRCIRE